MTKYPELTLIVNNRQVEWEEVKHWKARRAAVVLQLFKDLDQKLILNNVPLAKNNFYTLSDDELIEAAKETKLAISPEKMGILLENEFKKSGLLWHEFVADTSENMPLKEMHIQIDITGISPNLVGNLDNIGGTNALVNAFDLHPEHYIFGQSGNVQDVAETFGEFGGPTHFKLEMLNPKSANEFTTINPNTKKIIFGKGTLASDNFEINQYALHQFMPNKAGNGLHVDLGLFAPYGVPDVAIIGHQQHFAIEFASLFTKMLDQIHNFA
ncbi:hypothetical protein IWT140_00054 [Secundilactobacillus pentosiphilus]|uniref:Uncharacterized protein n=1 Tax=Secundilactobacillus pentosiphilus TaxID=1714682 RepID=A0A1Z5IL18_9LACO|nr:hypothetical protein [Secundilactobacillus pentosiphilus]GAX02457.1 hypothetical protein IWT140_00054 [Secundilactobacillus pentosiphilus]